MSGASERTSGRASGPVLYYLVIVLTVRRCQDGPAHAERMAAPLTGPMGGGGEAGCAGGARARHTQKAPPLSARGGVGEVGIPPTAAAGGP